MMATADGLPFDPLIGHPYYVTWIQVGLVGVFELSFVPCAPSFSTKRLDAYHMMHKSGRDKP